MSVQKSNLNHDFGVRLDCHLSPMISMVAIGRPPKRPSGESVSRTPTADDPSRVWWTGRQEIPWMRRAQRDARRATGPGDRLGWKSWTNRRLGATEGWGHGEGGGFMKPTEDCSHML